MDFNSINQSIGTAVNAKTEEMNNFTQSMDPNSAQDLVVFQQLMSEWSALTSLQSTTIKIVRDALQGIVQKM